MPRILKNPPANIRRQCSIQQPVPIPNIILNWSISDPLSRHSELAAAGYGHDIGHLRAGEEVHEAIRKLHRSGMISVIWPLSEVSGWFEFGGTSDGPCAAEVGIPGGLDEVEVKISD